MTASSEPILARRSAEMHGISWDDVSRSMASRRSLYDRGSISLHDLYSAIWDDIGISVSDDVSRDIEDADTASWMVRNERSLAWMLSFKPRGFKIGILTNMPPGMAAPFRDAYGDIFTAADAVVVSGEDGLVKPDPEIYHLLERRIGMPGDSLLFIDDVEQNCDGAIACGWRSIRFTDNDTVEEETERIIVENRV